MEGTRQLLTSNFKRRSVAALGAIALGMGAALGVSGMASADPATFGNIDGEATGSLTIHKFLYQSGSQQGDISEAPAAGDFTDPVAGVEFTVYPLQVAGAPVDLTVPTSWDNLATLTPGANCTAPAGYTLGAAQAMPLTAADGVSTIALPVGLYQVCETAVPVNIVSKAPAFILTVPQPFEKGWVYNVHAYPKNGDAAVNKSVQSQAALGLGAPVRFPVTSVIPDLGPNSWTGYAVRDTLDVRLTPNPATNGVLSVTANGADLPTEYYTATIVGQTVTVSVTPAGLAFLNLGPNAQAGTELVVTFDATVSTVGDGEIKNTAQLYVNNPGFDESGNPPIPSNEVTTNWGNLLVKKVADDSGKTALKDAVFEVYNADPAYAADCSAATATGDPISVNGATTFTSGADGVVNIAGLYVSDSVNTVVNAATRCYVVKETVAPAGYVLPAQPFTPVAVMIGETAGFDLEITNAQQNVPGLPMTGAAGKVLLVVIGLTAGGLAIALMLVNRRRSAAARS